MESINSAGSESSPTFVHVIPLHCPHANVHRRACFLQEQVFLSHLPAQLHLMIFSKLSGAAELSILWGFMMSPRLFFVYPSPILLDPAHVPAKSVLVGIHAYCVILKHHMLVGDAPVGCSWSWTQLFC